MFEENWPTLRAFLAMQTQWNIIAGMGDAVRQGLKYEVLPTVFSMLQITRKEQPEAFDGLRIMEREALRVFSEK